MRGLKFLVIAMGVLLVSGLILLIYGIYHQANGPDTIPTPAKAEAAPKATTPPAAQAAPRKTKEPTKPFGDVDIPLPEGCHVAAVHPTTSHRLFLHVGPSSPPCESIVVFDLNKGIVLGTLHIKPGP